LLESKAVRYPAGRGRDGFATAPCVSCCSNSCTKGAIARVIGPVPPEPVESGLKRRLQ